jgi:hypothetical protein
MKDEPAQRDDIQIQLIHTIGKHLLARASVNKSTINQQPVWGTVLKNHEVVAFFNVVLVDNTAKRKISSTMNLKPFR